jgi:hypothetical protein
VRGASLAAAALALACVSWAAEAQVLYKWIDADGKVQYSDTPPKNPKGPVTRIEPDVAPTPPAAPPAPARAPAPAATKAEPPEPDLASQRRSKRAALEARLKQAQAKVDAARKALAQAAGPEPDERQVFQQEMKAGQGGMHGLSAARSNCRKVVKEGKQVTVCPAVFATDAYYERLAKLEIALREAEDELAEAEAAWRHGVD